MQPMYQPHAVVYHCDNLYHQARIVYPEPLQRNIFFKKSFLSYPTIFFDQNAYARCTPKRNYIVNVGIHLMIPFQSFMEFYYLI